MSDFFKPKAPLGVPGTRAPGPPRETRPVVLVATSFSEASAIALRRGMALSKVLGAQLTIVRVVPPASPVRRLAARGAKVPTSEDILVEARRTFAWCESVVGVERPHPTVVVKYDIVEEGILSVAREVDASVIVLGDSTTRSSRLFESWGVVSSVIRRADRPVLVARQERAGRQIVAATNFMDDRFPALREAARLGARFGAHVTFVHNVDAKAHLFAATMLGLPVPDQLAPVELDVERRRLDLHKIALGLGADIETFVTMASRTSEAILDVARRCDADLVIVGAKARRGRLNVLAKNTAIAVARRARRSVLTVPLSEASRRLGPR